MGTRLQEIFCSICDKRVTLQEDTCTDENRKAVHTDCYVKRARLRMEAKLRPRHHFAKLLQCPESARQRDECIGQIGHKRLALVHGADDMEFREPVVPGLPRHEVLRDYSHCFAARPQHRVRDDAHQTHIASAVDQSDVPAH
jgi:hypothetical protein